MDTASPPASDQALIERVQDLQARLDASGDAATRELADQLGSALVQMYGAGLERILGGLLETGEVGERIAVGLADDPLVGTLLMIHDLHPVPLADRVQAALDSVRPYMESHGGDVQLLSLEHGVARLRLRGSCSDCSASSVTLELAIKQALEDAAPDLAGLEVEGMALEVTGIQLPMADGNSGSPLAGELPVIPAGPAEGSLPRAPATPSWYQLERDGEPPPEALVGLTVAGRELVIANVDGTLLAYRDRCEGCSQPIRDAELVAGALTCRHCGRTFFLPRAGRSVDGDRLQLEPVPLLRDEGRVKVALTG